jgi:casein kinase II subunit beta
MAKVMSKYLEGVYGTCPRALCNNQKCVPMGLSDKLHGSRVKIFCPKCDEVYMVQKYIPPTMKPGDKVPSGGGVQTATNLDGAYFGSSFPQMFIAWNEDLMEQAPKVYHYTPQISGFKIVGSRGSKYFNPAKKSMKTEDGLCKQKPGKKGGKNKRPTTSK